MSLGTRRVRPTPSSQRAPMGLAPAVLVMPRLPVQPRARHLASPFSSSPVPRWHGESTAVS